VLEAVVEEESRFAASVAKASKNEVTIRTVTATTARHPSFIIFFAPMVILFKTCPSKFYSKKH
jgi:hypothetical protein